MKKISRIYQYFNKFLFELSAYDVLYLFKQFENEIEKEPVFKFPNI